MKSLPVLPLLALFALASARLAAVDNPTLLINITVTIAETNRIEWSQPVTAGGDVVGARTWTIAGIARSSVNSSITGTNAIQGAGGNITGGDDTALNFANKGEIPVTVTVAVANGTSWNYGAAPGTDVFQLDASVDGGTAFDRPMNPGASLSVALAKNANCDLALQFTAPSAVTKKANTSVVTITAVQN